MQSHEVRKKLQHGVFQYSRTIVVVTMVTTVTTITTTVADKDNLHRRGRLTVEYAGAQLRS